MGGPMPDGDIPRRARDGAALVDRWIADPGWKVSKQYRGATFSSLRGTVAKQYGGDSDRTVWKMEVKLCRPAADIFDAFKNHMVLLATSRTVVSSNSLLASACYHINPGKQLK